MDANKSRTPLGMLAGYLGLVQGVTWAILCLLGILIYTKAWEPKYDRLNISYSDTIEIRIIAVFLTSDRTVHPNTIVTSTHFFIWTIIYLIISVAWAIVSGMLLLELKNQPIKQTYIKIWPFCTILICVLDIILTTLIGIDYGLYAREIQELLIDVAIAAGIIMTIVARGFVLWVVNATIATLLLLNKSEAPSNYYNDSNTINGFEPPSPTAYTNPRYDYENPNFVGRNSSPTSENFPKLPPIASTNERLAKIGKPGGGRSPYSPNYSQNVAPPSVPSPYVYPTSTRIPSPDYSPPTSPRIPPQPPLKPALKSRPDYNGYGYNNKY